jgi:hypothetical protein
MTQGKDCRGEQNNGYFCAGPIDGCRQCCQDCFGYVIRHFNVSSAGLKKLVGLDRMSKMRQGPPNHAMERTAGRSGVPLHFMKTRLLQFILAFASGR